MCEQTLQKSKLTNRFTLYLIMILLGVVSGYYDLPILKNVGLVVSDIFIRIFHFISLPIIALSLIVTLSSYSAEANMKKMWQRIIFYTLSTTVIAATVSCLLYVVIHPGNVNALSHANAAPIADKTNYLQHLSSLIPSNIFAPFLDYQVITVLLVGIVMGIAIRYIPEAQPRETVIQFFKGIHGIFLTITKWVVAIIPIGLFGFITVTVVQLRGGMNIGGVGEYLLVILLANLIQGFVVLPTWLKINNIKPFVMMRKMMPALSVAFFSKSSAGTLPITIETMEKNLNVDSKISRFVLPLCTSINMNGCAAFIFATVIYLMQNNGMHVTSLQMVMWILIATIAAVGNAGVPMGCFFLSASLLSSMNVPITLMAVILPFYSIIDMIETSLNVWSDSCVAKVLNDQVLADEVAAKTVPNSPITSEVAT